MSAWPESHPGRITDEQLLVAAERVAGTGSFEHDLATAEFESSSGLRRIFAAAERRLTREDLIDRVHPDDRELIDAAIRAAEVEGKGFDLQLRILRFDGIRRTIRARGSVLVDWLGTRRLVGTVQDVTQEAEVRAARDLLSYVVDSSDDAILTKSRDGTITSWNRGAERLYGYSAHEVIGSSISSIASPDRAAEQSEILDKVFGGRSIDHLETERIRKDGERIMVSLTVSPVRDANGRIVSAAVIARDISDRVRYEERLRHLADHDQLTELFNRRRFEEDLERELARAGRFGTGLALLSVDIDNFKAINDVAGHAAGDAVLQAVAGVLRARFRSTDILARLGGDEFCVLMYGAGVQEARAASEELGQSIRDCRPMFGGKPLRVSASIGVTAFESDDITADELLVNADLAMYAAKAQGRDRVVVYTPDQAWEARMIARQPWPERIRHALEHDQFVLHFQPILDLRSGEFSHGELLLRMCGPQGKLIGPNEFLPTAERLGLIHDIDRWVVRHAFDLIDSSGGQRVPVTGINLSADTVVGDPSMVELIESELARTRVDPERVVFEITETAAIANMGVATDFADGVNRLGCEIALDDFGSGFASFYYLKHLPVGYVKLDGEFIQNLPRSEVDEHMVKAIVALARSMGIKTVAESVADEETVELLRAYGVDYAQGFHVGRPQPLPAPALG